MKIPNVDGIYEAQQLHIHVNSEHTFDGTTYDFELHVVHGLVEGTGNSQVPNGVGGGSNQFAVYGYALQAGGSSNSAFQELLDKWILGQTCDTNARRLEVDAAAEDSKRGNLRKMQSTFDIYSLVPSFDFWHYGGGLTTPPCTEAVWFNIAKDPVVISDAQAASLTSIILSYAEGPNCISATIADPLQGTARPVQAQNGREVQLICGATETSNPLLTLRLSLCLLRPLGLGCINLFGGLWQ